MTLTPSEAQALTRLGCPPRVLDYYNERRHEMTERTDHAEEAARVLQLPTSMEDATEANALAYAQVHATLALVEQQRIQNLIALGNAEHGPYRYLDAGRTALRSEDAFGAAAHLLGIGEVQS